MATRKPFESGAVNEGVMSARGLPSPRPDEMQNEEEPEAVEEVQEEVQEVVEVVHAV